MALTDFFRINLPYGIARNKNGEWMAFNREYLPLGFINTFDYTFEINAGSEMPVYTAYKSLTDGFLLKLGWGGEDSVKRNEKGEIIAIFLYNDKTNPMNQSKDDPELWKLYFSKLESLSKIERKYPSSRHSDQ